MMIESGNTDIHKRRGAFVVEGKEVQQEYIKSMKLF